MNRQRLLLQVVHLDLWGHSMEMVSTCCNSTVNAYAMIEHSQHLLRCSTAMCLNQIVFAIRWNACNQIINQAVRFITFHFLLLRLTHFDCELWFPSTWYNRTMYVLLLLMSVQLYTIHTREWRELFFAKIFFIWFTMGFIAFSFVVFNVLLNEPNAQQ